MDSQSREPENLVQLMDVILSRVCRRLKNARAVLGNACEQIETLGINPENPQPEKMEILINYVETLRDENGELVFSALEIREYRRQVRKLSGRN
ncbi:MAG: hypothetical protein ACPL1Y_00545 [Thermoplasmata archaeon]